MNHQWKRIIKFILVLCVLLMVACIPFYAVRNMGYQFFEVDQKNKMIEQERNNSLDVLFMGDSECLTAFAPLQLFGEYGIPSYNCATAGQWVGDTVVILKKTLQNQKPSVIVLETSTLYSNPNTGKYLLSQYLPIFHYHEFYHDFDKAAEKKVGYIGDKGAYLTRKTEAYNGDMSKSSKSNSEQPMPDFNLQYLDEMLQICKDEGMKLVLTTAPSIGSWSKGKYAVIADWCTKNQISYIDYNDEENLQKIGYDSDTDSKDGGMHLNLSGSIKVTRDIGEHLKGMAGLTDHRSETDYSDWNYLYNTRDLYH